MILILKCEHPQESGAKAGSTLTCKTCGQRSKITAAIIAAAQVASVQAADEAKIGNAIADYEIGHDVPVSHPVSHFATRQGSDVTAVVTPGAPPTDNGKRLGDVDDATQGLGEPLRALTRLLLSTACARHHLRGTQASGWLGGVAAGPTQTGKTLAGLIVAAALGLDQVDAVKLTSAESEKSLWGRRVQQGRDAYAIQPAPVLGRPFAVIDELDKAPPAVRKATLRLLQGNTQVPGEGDQVIEIACTVLVTANGAVTVVPPEYRRRSAVIDMTGAPVVPQDLAAAVLDAVPVLPYRHLAPPAATLPGPLAREMQDALRASLTESAFQLTDVRALGLSALGRAALTGSGLDEAAEDTVMDYLACAATTGDLAVDEDQDDDKEDTARPAFRPADSYRDTIAVLGLAAQLASQLGESGRELIDVMERPGIPAGLASEAKGVLVQGARVRADLGRIGDTAGMSEVGTVAVDILGHMQQLAAKARPYASALSRQQADDYFGMVMDTAGHSPVPVITTARRALPAAAPAASGGMRLQAFVTAEQRLARTATPAAASTATAEAVAVETARREAAGLPPLTGPELSRYYLARPAAVIPLSAAPRHPRRSLLRRNREAS